MVPFHQTGREVGSREGKACTGQSSCAYAEVEDDVGQEGKKKTNDGANACAPGSPTPTLGT
jgi:hypothetical protein